MTGVRWSLRARVPCASRRKGNAAATNAARRSSCPRQNRHATDAAQGRPLRGRRALRGQHRAMAVPGVEATARLSRTLAYDLPS